MIGVLKISSFIPIWNWGPTHFETHLHSLTSFLHAPVNIDMHARHLSTKHCLRGACQQSIACAAHQAMRSPPLFSVGLVDGKMCKQSTKQLFDKKRTVALIAFPALPISSEHKVPGQPPVRVRVVSEIWLGCYNCFCTPPQPGNPFC